MSDITGGCQCGAVRYHITGGSYAVYACHCRECQKQSASAFALSMPVLAQNMTISGEMGVWERRTDSGNTTRCTFCPSCGTRLYHQSATSPEFMTVKAGTLDAPGSIAPIAHLWVMRKQPWVRLDPAVPAFATQPDDLRAWRNALLGERAGIDFARLPR